jgi:hypothetical protein
MLSDPSPFLVREDHRLFGSVGEGVAVAPFRRQDEGRVDFGILRNSPVFVYYDREYLERIVQWLRANAYRICDMDSSTWTTEAAACSGLSLGLQIDDPYDRFVNGLNTDALDDDLEDIEIPEDGGTVAVLRGIDALMNKFPATAHAILNSLAASSRYHSLFGLRFMTLVLCNDSRLAFHDRIGGTRPIEQR